MRSHRPRMRFVFWLNLANPLEFTLAEVLERCRSERKFTGLIRDGIRLVWDLRKGNVDVLLELFPWVKEALTQKEQPGIQDGFMRLEQLILQHNAIPADMSAQPQTVNQFAPKALSVPQFLSPSLDDEDEFDTVILKKDTSTNSATNFINSMFNLQQ